MHIKNYIPHSSEIYNRYARLTQHSKHNQCNPHQQSKEKKNHINISIVLEKAFDKIQYQFMILKKRKTLSKLGIEGNFLKQIKKKNLPKPYI